MTLPTLAGLTFGLAFVGHAVAADCLPIEGLEQFQLDGVGPAEAKCSGYLSEAGTTGTSCHWSFPFRDEQAVDFAETLWQSLTTCRPGNALGADQLVNHPDSYDLREWETPDGTFAISVKDKGGLNRTLVFFRIEPKAS